jgi:probable HAF family extracellular repeat protein
MVLLGCRDILELPGVQGHETGERGDIVRTKTIIIALTALLLAAGKAHADSLQYSAANIGSFGGSGGTLGYAINNSGTVVGGSYLPSGYENAFSYNNGVMTDLGTLGGASSTAYGINDAGTIVGGSSVPSGNSVAFSYSSGAMTGLNIGALQGYTNATGINNAGVIVGDGYVNPNTYSQPFDAFIYSGGTYSIISNPGGTVAANGINSAGVVAGGYALNYGNFFWDPFTYSNGTFNSLGAYGPSWVTYATAINDSGTIVGYHSNPGTNQGGNAFSYSNGTYTPLGALPGGGNTAANAINAPGVIVGFSGGDAFVYSNGVMSDLNSDLANTLPTTLTNATAINDEGQIVALGANGDTYLLTPESESTTPEPASIWLLGMGGLLLLSLRLSRL